MSHELISRQDLMASHGIPTSSMTDIIQALGIQQKRYGRKLFVKTSDAKRILEIHNRIKRPKRRSSIKTRVTKLPAPTTFHGKRFAGETLEDILDKISRRVDTLHMKFDSFMHLIESVSKGKIKQAKKHQMLLVDGAKKTK